ncbi:MAG: hypothetical protein J7497_09380 [Chitinophagaceae bacterium]|nr:hypothetical protein [Chitinophagaceae bacterium]
MQAKHELRIGDYISSPTKNGESIITALFEEYVFVNKEEQPVNYVELGLIKIGISLLKNAGFYPAEQTWEWKHDALPDHTLKVSYDGIARFKHVGKRENNTRNFNYTHQLQHEFERLTNRQLAIKW